MTYQWRQHSVVASVQIWVDDATEGGPFYLIDGGEVRTSLSDVQSDARAKGRQGGRGRR